MALLQRNARSLLLLRLIGKNKDVQSLEVRALSHLLRPHNGFDAAEFPLRPYSAVSSTTATPFSKITQNVDSNLKDSLDRRFANREGPHSSLGQTGVLPFAHALLHV